MSLLEGLLSCCCPSPMPGSLLSSLLLCLLLHVAGDDSKMSCHTGAIAAQVGKAAPMLCGTGLLSCEGMHSIKRTAAPMLCGAGLLSSVTRRDAKLSLSLSLSRSLALVLHMCRLISTATYTCKKCTSAWLQMPIHVFPKKRHLVPCQDSVMESPNQTTSTPCQFPGFGFWVSVQSFSPVYTCASGNGWNNSISNTGHPSMRAHICAGGTSYTHSLHTHPQAQETPWTGSRGYNFSGGLSST